MNYQTLLVETKHAIGIIWMNRPERRNALDEVMITEMTAAVRALDDDPAVRVVILAGVGQDFCVGEELKEMQRKAGCSVKQNHADAMRFATLLSAISSVKKPTLARVQGAALAGGVGLVAACDMAVAAYEAEFCLPDVRFGLIPATVGPYVVRAMGERAARRYCLSAERFTAAEAYRVGLLSDIAPLEELDGRINEFLGHLIQGGPAAQALSKACILALAGAPITAQLMKDGATCIAAALASEEGQEGVRAFTEKRKAAWFAPKKKAAAPKGMAKTAPKAAAPKTRAKVKK